MLLYCKTSFVFEILVNKGKLLYCSYKFRFRPLYQFLLFLHPSLLKILQQNRSVPVLGQSKRTTLTIKSSYAR